MTIFRIISIIALLILVGAVAFDLKRRLRSWKAVMEFLRGEMKNFVLVRREKTVLRSGRTIAMVRKMVYAVAVLCFFILAGTGFAPILFAGDHLTGILLVIHVTVAPLFALSLSAAALLWAHSQRFNEDDWRVVRHLGDSGLREKTIRFATKVGFWLILLLSLPLMLTVILELFPLFGTEGEAFLIRLHGYSALSLMLVALGHIYLTTLRYAK
jgi:cytochrome b subunit of formate dehydrogenase